ncbi:MAG: UDP-N-acetylmuramoyl-tripeptide--D-alanyl-D-alanine ligase [Candidatus Eremiobacteraeota bacterium]|nr:UDP-N-acetylmuramoyl-tripeptide--D-alanyl-D-alanine ligase [Candidatus Eremiobacteraeota bacterium]
MTLTFEEAARATAAKVQGGVLPRPAIDVSIDTRTIAPGQTYLALRGDRFDGHAYIDQALEKGAAALVVDAAPNRVLEVATLIVADTKNAYMALAGAARDKFSGPVIAITGSTGKTTTKVLLSQLLATAFGTAVLASPANENNEIGVSKLLLAVSTETQALVVEMGARHFGDIAELVTIARPQVGILTNVGEAHLEIMGSPERLAETKWAIFSQGAAAVLNVHDEVSRTRAGGLERPPRWFGFGQATLPNIHPSERGVFLQDRHTVVVIEGDDVQTYHIDARLPGDYNLENLAAALAGAIELGCAVEDLIAAIPHLELPSGRYERIALSGGVQVIFDAYNASLTGMLATLDAFAQEPGHRRIAVLASMAELGSGAPQMHATVGRHAAQAGLDLVLVGGDYAEQLASGALSGGLDEHRVVRFENNVDAISWLREHAAEGDIVLLKGSRKYRLEEVLEGMRS